MDTLVWWTPVLGLLGQVWLITVVTYMAVHWRNSRKWTREHRRQRVLGTDKRRAQ